MVQTATSSLPLQCLKIPRQTSDASCECSTTLPAECMETWPTWSGYFWGHHAPRGRRVPISDRSGGQLCRSSRSEACSPWYGSPYRRPWPSSLGWHRQWTVQNHRPLAWAFIGLTLGEVPSSFVNCPVDPGAKADGLRRHGDGRPGHPWSTWEDLPPPWMGHGGFGWNSVGLHDPARAFRRFVLLLLGQYVVISRMTRSKTASNWATLMH